MLTQSKVEVQPQEWQSLLVQSAVKMKRRREQAKEKAIKATFGKVQFGDNPVLEVQEEMRYGWK